MKNNSGNMKISAWTRYMTDGSDVKSKTGVGVTAERSAKLKASAGGK